MEDIPNYLGNPINAFTLIKRLTTDLDNIEASIKIGTGNLYNVAQLPPSPIYPILESPTILNSYPQKAIALVTRLVFLVSISDCLPSGTLPSICLPA